MGPRINLDEQMERRVGKRTLLTVNGKEVPVMPATLGTEKNLLYRAWVEANRAYVTKISGGKLGYVHMNDMSQGALDRLQLDLDAENQSREGVVIDIRNNNGGFVNAFALDIFTRRPYLRMTERGKEETPARTALGQRTLEKPTVLVVNQLLAFGRGGFHRGLPGAEAGQGGGRADGGVDYFYVEHVADRWDGVPDSDDEDSRGGGGRYGTASACGGCGGEQAGGGKFDGEGFAVGRRGEDVAGAVSGMGIRFSAEENFSTPRRGDAELGVVAGAGFGVGGAVGASRRVVDGCGPGVLRTRREDKGAAGEATCVGKRAFVFDTENTEKGTEARRKPFNAEPRRRCVWRGVAVGFCVGGAVGRRERVVVGCRPGV